MHAGLERPNDKVSVVYGLFLCITDFGHLYPDLRGGIFSPSGQPTRLQAAPKAKPYPRHIVQSEHSTSILSLTYLGFQHGAFWNT